MPDPARQTNHEYHHCNDNNHHQDDEQCTLNGLSVNISDDILVSFHKASHQFHVLSVGFVEEIYYISHVKRNQSQCHITQTVIDNSK